jgi:hypothetical protein
MLGQHQAMLAAHPRAPPVTIATRPSHNLAIAPSRFCVSGRAFLG